MTDPNEDPTVDIAWMRRLAEEGGDAPMQGASILMVAGLIFGGASLYQWAELTGLVPAEGAVTGVGWLVATGVFLVSLFLIIARLKRQGGVRTAGNRATTAVWSAMGWGIFALFVSITIMGWRTGEQGSLLAMSLSPSIIMVFYGIGWAVSGAMYRSQLMWGLAIGSLVAAPLLAAFTGHAEQYLAYAAALFLLMALPGWMLMRRARA